MVLPFGEPSKYFKNNDTLLIFCGAPIKLASKITFDTTTHSLLRMFNLWFCRGATNAVDASKRFLAHNVAVLSALGPSGGCV